MPVVFGVKLRWVTDKVPCTVCHAPHDGKWYMVKVGESDLLCKKCLASWYERGRDRTPWMKGY